ncbi:FadR/GntR family transcriptional regulator [Sphingomonas endophytica]|uniref:GntR family transcriptional regulator n=1 Tax=Sphingomonas endophytica TaxID=869719 RepID=A0A147I4T8_9SPHN|nr:FadR/GntR family transcriptional regulator [Sphingomonas endophytica]KTT73556.1 GntR family transcriptional regulator [Sphingomonas endophytica]
MTASSTPLGSEPSARPRDVRGGITHDLGVAIVSGQLPPGTALLSEDRFSSEHGVSRGAYREALRILAAKGLVQNRPKSATRVNERSRWSMLDLDVLGWMFEGEPSRDFIAGIFELRSIVEPSAAALAAVRRDEKQLARMGHALEEMERYGLLDSVGRAADQRFHLLILEATRNEPLSTLSSSIAAAVEWTTRFARHHRQQRRDPMPDHHAVYAALVAGDAERARSTMATLIENALRDADD